MRKALSDAGIDSNSRPEPDARLSQLAPTSASARSVRIRDNISQPRPHRYSQRHALTRTVHRRELTVRQRARHLPRAALDQDPCGAVPVERRQDRPTSRRTRTPRFRSAPSFAEVRARVATDAERDRLWPKFVAFYPGYEFFQRHAKGRQIPIVILDPR
jgi:F420H(2)-dependent quinone reductase